MRSAIRLSFVAFTLAAFSACGGSSNSTVTTSATAPRSPVGSSVTATGPTTTAASSPAAANTLASSSEATWTVNGQVSGTAQLAVTSCDVVGSQYEINLAGTLNGASFYVGPAFNTTAKGTLNYDGTSGNALFVEAKYGTGTALAHWDARGGAPGTTGTATIDTRGSGSLNVTVPVSANSPGGATAPITLLGQWTCP